VRSLNGHDDSSALPRTANRAMSTITTAREGRGSKSGVVGGGSILPSVYTTPSNLAGVYVYVMRRCTHSEVG